MLLPLGQALGELAGGRRLARALQADHHDGRPGPAALRSIGDLLGAERRDQLVMDDLDDHLAGLDRLHDLGADGLLAHPVGEGAHDFERDVGLEQRPAHLAQRRRDVRRPTGRRVRSGR